MLLPFTDVQRGLTIDFITRRHLNIPAIWLKPEGATPSAADALAPPEALSTNLEGWERDQNLGLRLVDGHIELRIRAPDDIWSGCFFEACRHLGVDARAAFGWKGWPISSVILKIEDPETIAKWTRTWPGKHKDKQGRWIETKFVTSTLPTKLANAVWRNSQPLPGSTIEGRVAEWRPMGKPAQYDLDLGLEDLEPRPLAATSVDKIVRAIAYATLLYWIRAYLDKLTDWDEILIRVIGGWLARLVLEGRDINARGRSLEGVCWSPIDSAEFAEDLIRFLGAKSDLRTVFIQAGRELEHNPIAPIPSWNALGVVLSLDAKIGIRRAFRAGIDLDQIERMSERYAFNVSENTYLDREYLLQGLPFQRSGDHLVDVWANKPVYVGKQRLNPFRLYMGSQLRTDVQRHDFWPGHEPGAILRYSPVHGLLNGEDQHPDEYRVLNTFPGFTIKPIATIDPMVMRDAVSALDRLLGYLTQDNSAQMMWIKKWIAWIIRHPEDKQQSCPVIVGGQGIGKTHFGDTFLRALFDSLAGRGESALLADNKFVIAPFLNKLIVFIDEVRLESISAINIIKQMVRNDTMSGQMKHKDQRDYRVPARLVVCTNTANIGLTPEDAADRALFFIVAWTAENRRMSDRAFQAWTNEVIKPFCAEHAGQLQSVSVKQHLMRYFVDLECTRAELEDLTLSSRNEEIIVRATMSRAREIARRIVADARVLDNKDITTYFSSANLRAAIERIDGRRTKVTSDQVLAEFDRAGLIEKQRSATYKFKWGYARLIEVLGEAHGLPIEPDWDYRPGDWDENEVKSKFGGLDWRGKDKGQRSKSYDPDAMEAE